MNPDFINFEIDHIKLIHPFVNIDGANNMYILVKYNKPPYDDVELPDDDDESHKVFPFIAGVIVFPFITWELDEGYDNPLEEEEEEEEDSESDIGELNIPFLHATEFYESIKTMISKNRHKFLDIWK